MVETGSPLKNQAIKKKKGFNFKKDYQLVSFLKEQSRTNLKFMKKFT